MGASDDDIAIAAVDALLARQAEWRDARAAAALLAVDPGALGGVALRGLAGPVREAWLGLLKASVQADVAPPRPWRRMPLHIGDDRLLGGLDLAATLQAGRPVAQRGLLAECDGGVLVVAMAERLEAGSVARLAAVLDSGRVAAERDGLSLHAPARFGVVALDEAQADDEGVSPVLLERLAFHLDLSRLALRDLDDPHGEDGLQAFSGLGDLNAGPADFTPAQASAALAAAFGRPNLDLADARRRLPQVHCPDEPMQALCAAALALGAGSVRASMWAVRAARASAALRGADVVDADDAALAARLVLAPRATLLPAPPESEREPPHDVPPQEQPLQEPPPQDQPPPHDGETDADADTPPAPPQPVQPIDDVVLAAAQAALPAHLLNQLLRGEATGVQRRAGRAGLLQSGQRRGRPAGVLRGSPGGGVRLDLVQTLRAAAPWQRVRRALRPAGSVPPRIEVRPEDFHIPRLRQRTETTTVFVIDASGSAALHRLAEAKGAVELLLADCYVRRDRVAVLAFRGRGAELLLPPTRSLVRAKRSLAGLPGGGGTPLAAGLQAAAVVADAARRRGESPLVVLLTDGRANIARDGSPGRAQAEADALAVARDCRAQGLACLVVDTSVQPAPAARRLAAELGGRYLALPQAGSHLLSAAVRLAGASTARAGG